MTSWNSSPHPISDVRDWKTSERLEIRPSFQRQEVWSMAAKVMLMDTILRKIPMPKVFLASSIKEDRVYRIVIDGQQRISSILDFINNGFTLSKPFDSDSPYYGKFFFQLPENIRNDFLQYRIDFNEAIGFSEDEIREAYSRLNKYSVALTKQELRRADFPGDFLDLAEHLAGHQFLDDIGLFTVANRRRLADVEFVSEVLAALIDGAQEKKDNLDDFYLNYAKWDEDSKKAVKERFLSIIVELELIFSSPEKMKLTRFRQKADFYCLIIAIDEIKASGGSLNGKNLKELLSDLYFLNDFIAPESYQTDLREYAIKCVSQANSISSRVWRRDFIKIILRGTYHSLPPETEWALKVFYRLATEEDDSYCPSTIHSCEVCGGDIDTDLVLGWHKKSECFQVHNILFFHYECALESKSDFIAFTSEGEYLGDSYIKNINQINLFES